MGWLSSYGSDNMIVDAVNPAIVRYTIFGGSVCKTWVMTRLETRYRYVCMTLSAAQACATTLAAASTTQHPITPVVRRQNDVGAYQVEVCEMVNGQWSRQP